MNLPFLRERLRQARLAVIGDFCLDIYWLADMRLSELSRETPHYPLPVVSERLSAGGAGNVAANILALEPASVQCLGIFGEDWRGDAYQRILQGLGADIHAIVRDASRLTDTYIKPLRQGHTSVVYEDPRLDFTNYTAPSPATEEKLLAALESLDCDVLCVCDQMPFGCITPRIRQKLQALGRAGLTIVVDSRSRIADYRDVLVKPNDIEACRAVGVEPTHDLETLREVTRRLSLLTGRPAIVTVGAQGCLIGDGETPVVHVPAVTVTGEIDICGAGDTFLAATAGALAADAPLQEAAALGCRASSITIRKLKMTGTASWNELLNP